MCIRILDILTVWYIFPLYLNRPAYLCFNLCTVKRKYIHSVQFSFLQTHAPTPASKHIRVLNSDFMSLAPKTPSSSASWRMNLWWSPEARQQCQKQVADVGVAEHDYLLHLSLHDHGLRLCCVAASTVLSWCPQRYVCVVCLHFQLSFVRAPLLSTSLLVPFTTRQATMAFCGHDNCNNCSTLFSVFFTERSKQMRPANVGCLDM